MRYMRNGICVAFAAGVVVASYGAMTVARNRNKDAEAAKQVEALTASVVASYESGEKTRPEVAKEFEILSGRDSLDQESRFVSLEGAFRMYADANMPDDMLRVVRLMSDKWRYSNGDIAEVMGKKRVDFGLTCQDRACPLLIESLRNGIGWSYDEPLATCQTLAEALGRKCEGGGSKSYRCVMETDDPSHFMGKGIVTAVYERVVVKVADIGVFEKKHYYSCKTRKLFQTDVRFCSSVKMSRMQFMEMAGPIVDAFRKSLDCEMDMRRDPRDDDEVDEELRKIHAEGVEVCKNRGNAVGFNIKTAIITFRDSGTDAIRANGFVFEDVHGRKTLKLHFVNDVDMKAAWNEGFSRRIGKDSKEDPVKYWRENNRAGEKKYRYAMIGRVFKYGLYGYAQDLHEAAYYYEKAAALGNDAAELWCKRSEQSAIASKGMRIRHKSIGAFQLSLLSIGGQWDNADGYGFAPFINGLETKIIQSDRANGVNIGLFVSDLRGSSCQLQVAPIMNFVSRLAVGSGLQVAGLINGGLDAGEFCGLQFAGVASQFQKCASVVGVQVSGVGNWDSRFSGMQVSGVCNSSYCAARGVQLSGAVNHSCDARGVQIAGFGNVVRKDFEADFGGNLPVGIKIRHKGCGDASGVQFGGIINLVEHHMTGVQFGLINIAGDMHGIQLGLINYIGGANEKCLPIVNWNFK